MQAVPNTVLNVSQNYRLVTGADRYFLMHTRLLESRGHEVVPYTARHDDDLNTPYRQYFPEAADYEHLRPIDAIRHVYSRSARDGLRDLLGATDPDIAHLHNYYGKLTPSILGVLRSKQIPIVQTLHNYKLVCPVNTLYSGGEVCEACQGRSFWRATEKRCNRGSLIRSIGSTVEAYASRRLGDIEKIDRFIAVSDFVRGKVIELGVPQEKVVTVHNFADLEGIGPVTGPGELILFVGRLERLKGIFTLLEAVRGETDLQVVYAGHGTDRGELESLIENWELSHVRVAGFMAKPQLDELYRKAMMVVAPSEWYEPFGLIMLEAFGRGRAVVATDIGGIPEVVADGIDGVLVPPRDPQALRDAITGLAGDENRRRRMGEAGRKKAETAFSPEVHYQKILSVYEHVAGG